MVMIFGFSIKIWFKNIARWTNLKKKWTFGPPLIIIHDVNDILLGGVQNRTFFHLAMFLNQIFMLNPKIITIFPYIYFLAGYFMFLISVIFSDSYKNNNEKVKRRPLENACGCINNCYTYILVKSRFSTYFHLLLHHQKETSKHTPQEIKYKTCI